MDNYNASSRDHDDMCRSAGRDYRIMEQARIAKRKYKALEQLAIAIEKSNILKEHELKLWEQTQEQAGKQPKIFR